MTRPYVLGHSERELERLQAQALFVAPITQRFLLEAGLAPGMRVLDVGSGAGDVAFAAAQIVGSNGEIVGVDRSPTALAIARSRAAARSLSNVSFEEGDPAEMVFDRAFDAVIGRYVLQFQAEPAAMLSKLAAHLRPGGLLVFHEIDWGGLSSFPPVPTFERCCSWGIQALRAHGTETRMGAKLHATFVSAGLPPPAMRLEARIGGIPAITPWVDLFVSLIGTLLPEIERRGIATAEEVAIETLAERVTQEAIALTSVIVSHNQVAAWVKL